MILHSFCPTDTATWKALAHQDCLKNEFKLVGPAIVSSLFVIWNPCGLSTCDWILKRITRRRQKKRFIHNNGKLFAGFGLHIALFLSLVNDLLMDATDAVLGEVNIPSSYNRCAFTFVHNLDELSVRMLQLDLIWDCWEKLGKARTTSVNCQVFKFQNRFIGILVVSWPTETRLHSMCFHCRTNQLFTVQSKIPFFFLFFN